MSAGRRPPCAEARRPASKQRQRADRRLARSALQCSGCGCADRWPPNSTAVAAGDADQRAGARPGRLAGPAPRPALRAPRSPRGCGRTSPPTARGPTCAPRCGRCGSAWGAAAELLEAARGPRSAAAPTLWVDARRGRRAPDADRTVSCCPGIDDEWARRARAEQRRAPGARADELADGPRRTATSPSAVRWSRRRCALRPWTRPRTAACWSGCCAPASGPGRWSRPASSPNGCARRSGVRPSPATRAVHARRRTAGHGAAPAPAGVRPGRRARPGSGTLAGGGRRRGQVVVLTGEAGIGKTTLLAELAHRVERRRRPTRGRGRHRRGRARRRSPPGWTWRGRSPAASGRCRRRRPGRPSSTGSRPASARGSGHPEQPPRVAAPGAGAAARLRGPAAAGRVVVRGAADAARHRRRAPRRPGQPPADGVHRPPAGPAARPARADPPRGRPRDPSWTPCSPTWRAGRSGSRTIDVGPIGDGEVGRAGARRCTRWTSDQVRAWSRPRRATRCWPWRRRVRWSAGSDGPPPNLRTAVRGHARPAAPRRTRGAVELLAVAGRPLRAGPSCCASAVRRARGAGGGSEGLLAWRDGRLGFRHELLRAAGYAETCADPTPLHDRVADALRPRTTASRWPTTCAGRPAAAAAGGSGPPPRTTPARSARSPRPPSS